MTCMFGSGWRNSNPRPPAPKTVSARSTSGTHGERCLVTKSGDTADVDAFSLPFHDRPVIVLGADKNDRKRSRFDAG